MLESFPRLYLDIGGEGTSHQTSPPPTSSLSLSSSPSSPVMEGNPLPAQNPGVDGGHPRRERQLPTQYRDSLPESAPIIAPTDKMCPPSEAPAPFFLEFGSPFVTIRTMAIAFGLWNPDSFVLCDDLAFGEAQTKIQATSSADYEPSPSKKSNSRPLTWVAEHLKSNGEVNKLVDILLHSGSW